jgi:hypothetical protein
MYTNVVTKKLKRCITIALELTFLFFYSFFCFSSKNLFNSKNFVCFFFSLYTITLGQIDTWMQQVFKTDPSTNISKCCVVVAGMIGDDSDSKQSGMRVTRKPRAPTTTSKAQDTVFRRKQR